MENPGQSPRTPIYAGTSKLPQGFDICGHHRYNENAVLWHYRKANKLSQVQWGNAKKLIYDNVLRYEEKAMEELPALEKKVAALLKDGKKKEAQKLLNQYTSDFAGATRQTWSEIERTLWERYWTGF